MEKFVNTLMKAGAGAVGLGVVGFCVNSSLYTVDGGERAIIFDYLRGGLLPDEIQPGTHLLMPWMQVPKYVNVRSTPYNISSETGTKDLQTVSVKLRVLYRPKEGHLFTIYRQLGPNYANVVFDSIANEVLKGALAHFDATELVTHREAVSLQIRERLMQRAELHNVVLDDVSITHIGFSKDFMTSIEAKQVAQQEAERMRYFVAYSEQQKIAEITRAEGEAIASELVQKAMSTSDAYLALKKIEAAREIAETLARSRNITYLPSGGNMLLQLPSQ